MALKTPKRKWTLWLFANVCVLAQVPAAMLYYSRQLNAGAYPLQADSISIPILGTAITILVLIIPLNISWWILLRRYPGSVPIRVMSKGFPPLARVIALLGTVMAGICVATAILQVRAGAFESGVLFLICGYVAFAMRAAFIAARSTL